MANYTPTSVKNANVILSCSHGHVIPKSELESLPPTESSECWILKNHCPREKHFLCPQCREAIHYPEDNSERFIITSPLPNQSLVVLLRNKTDFRYDMQTSSKEFTKILNSILNELKKTKDNETLFDTLKRQTNFKEIIDELQIKFAGHVDLSLQLLTHAAICFIEKEGIKLSECGVKEGIITAVRTLSKKKAETADKEDKEGNIQHLIFCQTELHNESIKDKIDLLFEKLPHVHFPCDQIVQELTKCADQVKSLAEFVNEDSQLILPCSKGHVFLLNELKNLPATDSSACLILKSDSKENCRRKQHVICSCREKIHYPEDNIKRLMSLPINYQTFLDILENKAAVRLELDNFNEEVARVSKVIQNELTEFGKLMNSNERKLKSKSLNQADQHSEEIGDVNIDITERKSRTKQLIEEQQVASLCNIDLSLEYAISAGIGFLNATGIEWSECDKNGVIELAKKRLKNWETFEYLIKHARKAYFLTFNKIVEEFEKQRSDKREIAFDKLPKFWERFKDFETSGSNLEARSVLLRDTVRELEKKCIEPVETLRRIMKEDAEVDKQLTMRISTPQDYEKFKSNAIEMAKQEDEERFKEKAKQEDERLKEKAKQEEERLKAKAKAKQEDERLKEKAKQEDERLKEKAKQEDERLKAKAKAKQEDERLRRQLKRHEECKRLKLELEECLQQIHCSDCRRNLSARKKHPESCHRCKGGRCKENDDCLNHFFTYQPQYEKAAEIVSKLLKYEK